MMLILLLLWRFPQEDLASDQDLVHYVSSDIELGSFNSKNIAIAELLRQISKERAINLIVDQNVTTQVTLQLHNISLNQLLNLLVRAYDVQCERIGEVVYIKMPSPSPPPQPVNEIKWNSESGMLAFNLEGMDIQTFSRTLTSQTGTNVLVGDGSLRAQLKGFQAELPFQRALETLLRTNNLRLLEEEGVFLIQARLQETTEGDSQAQGTAQNRNLPQLSVENGLWSAHYTATPLPQIFSDILAKGEVQMTIVPKLEGEITVHVANLVLDEMLHLLLSDTQFGFVKYGEVYVIGDKSLGTLTESVLISFQHINAEMVNQMLPSTLTEGVTVTILKELNSLLFSGDRAKVRNLQNLVSQLDQNIPQVLIEVMVVDYSYTNVRDLGLTFTNGDNEYFPDLNLTLDGFRDADGHFQIRRLPSNFSLQIKALEAQGKVKIISKPHIAALNGHEAEITIGTKQFYRLESEELVGDQSPRVRTSQEIREIEANIHLKITPWVSGNGEVTTVIEPSFNTFLGQVVDNIPPPVSSRQLKSTVRLKDGETIILGGLIENFISSDLKGVPLISKIPLLGALFRNHASNDRQSELVIYLTPHIYYGNEGSVEFIREKEGLNYQLDIKKQKQGVGGDYPKNRNWFQRWRDRRKNKERPPETLEDPKGGHLDGT